MWSSVLIYTRLYTYQQIKAYIYNVLIYHRSPNLLATPVLNQFPNDM